MSNVMLRDVIGRNGINLLNKGKFIENSVYIVDYKTDEILTVEDDQVNVYNVRPYSKCEVMAIDCNAYMEDEKCIAIYIKR